MAPNHSSSDKSVVAPQPIPAPPAFMQQQLQQQQQQGPGEQHRRNSFTGWSQSIFGLPQSTRTQTFPGGGTSPPAAFPQYQVRAQSFSNSADNTNTTAAGASSENTPSAFSGIGLFRRFSTSNAQQQMPPAQIAHNALGTGHALYTAEATARGGSSSAELSDAVAGSHHPWSAGHHKSPAAFQHLHGHHPQPRALDEVRARDDPPSRPDSRMRNLMLSGQFLI
ncbi:hypothetical protein GGI25_000677 [Coemansia spiralis]|uniref:Uncharacterized protein n=2 Tax=Coemansia TaxID=4863 RepID=A0A9W8L0T6_9FUNG|nr:hypothetical protein BX070DRAFT_116101 [Coemansia spiralis]KAJ1995701.1 hypothetical protein EDC05_000635 [Coemansia umbellata]KAJ2623695.1 hypothetical protein GGI26_002142 [Coemansia sp. RSA 1358]KAJ2680385.1 hypothetical protein GGI25_000677 [Coemansia spiralis]